MPGRYKTPVFRLPPCRGWLSRQRREVDQCPAWRCLQVSSRLSRYSAFGSDFRDLQDLSPALLAHNLHKLPFPRGGDAFHPIHADRHVTQESLQDGIEMAGAFGSQPVAAQEQIDCAPFAE